MSLVSRIKTEAKRQSGAKKELFYVKPDEKQRVRFLVDLEDGLEVRFFEHFKDKVKLPDPELWGFNSEELAERVEDRDDQMREAMYYIWPVWNYDRKSVQLLMGKANQWSPVLQIIAVYENYGTLTDRDYTISRSGDGLDTSYSVLPLDKKPFKGNKIKVPNRDGILEILWKAFTVEAELDKLGISGDAEEDDDDYDDDYDDEDDWDDEDDE